MTTNESPNTIASPLDIVSDSRSRLRAVLSNQMTILIVVLAVLLAFFDFRNSVFLGTSEINNLITDFSELVLLAVAETFVIVSGGIDLAVGSTLAISGIVSAAEMNHMQGHMGLAPLLLIGTLIALAVGMVVGTVNAVLITMANLEPFVATLVTLGAGFGLALVLSAGGLVGYNQAAIEWSSTGWWVFSWLDLMVIGVVIVAVLYMHFTRFGRYTFAIGSNPFASRAAGINVKRHLFKIYVLSGALAGLTGMFYNIHGGGGDATNGQQSNLNAIACVVIGGVALSGGRGNVGGVLAGCAIVTVVQDGLIVANVPPAWSYVATGAIIAVAAALQALRNNSARNR